MRKRTVSKLWHQIQNISIIGLTIAFIACGAVSIVLLRANNLKMVELRQAVYTADEKGGDVETALRNLRLYVYSHMNTNLRAGSSSSEPPVQLVHRFNAAVAAEQARIAALNNSTKVYADAQAQCERSSLPLTARAQCIQDYVVTHGNGAPQLNLPPKEFYTFDFTSPFWSSDAAGWSLAATILLGILLLVRIAAGIVVRNYLKS